MKKLLMLVLVGVISSFCLAGFQVNAVAGEHPASDHPTKAEKEKSEHPEAEEEKSEHPKAEETKSEHPKAEETKSEHPAS